MTKSAGVGKTLRVPRHFINLDLLPFRRQQYSSMSDEGTAHNSHFSCMAEIEDDNVYN